MAIHDQPDYELSDISEDQCIAFDELIDEFIDFSAGSNSELTPEQPRQQITSNHPDASGMNTRELPSEATPATSIESLLSSVVGNDANGFMPTLSGSTQHTLKDVVADCGSVAPTFPHPIVGSSSSYAPYTYEESRCKDYNYGIHGGVTDDAHYLPSMIPTVGEPERGGPVTPPRENGYNLQPVEIPPSINGSPMKSPEDRTRDLVCENPFKKNSNIQPTHDE
ncbi:hypothetical protein BGZ58_010023 [Dissophora ornata]|nr:hypothetical protein BGZ58_010023 [Dissophora ornata]